MFHDWQIFHLSARHPKIAKLNPPESRHHEGTCVVIIWPFWLNHCCLTAVCINIWIRAGVRQSRWCSITGYHPDRMLQTILMSKRYPNHAYDLLLVSSVILLPHYRNSQQHIYTTISISFSNKHTVWYDAIQIVTLQHIDLADAFIQSDPQFGYNPTIMSKNYANISKMLNYLKGKSTNLTY